MAPADAAAPERQELAEEPPPPAGRIAGRVVAGDGPEAGAAIADARLILRQGGRVVATARGDGDGAFVLDLRDAPAGRLEIEAIAPERIARLVELELADGEKTEDLEIELDSGAVLEGSVFSEAGEPLAGVLVELLPAEGLRSRLAAPRALSGPAGAYRLAGLPAGRQLLRASRVDLVSAEETFEFDGGVRRADWTLSAGLTLAGRIADSRGRPVVGARILAFSGPAGAAGPPAKSGLDGRFRLAGVAPGQVRLRGEPVEGAAVERLLDLAPGEEAAEVELAVPASGVIEGRLLGASPAALAKAEVWATGGLGELRRGYVEDDGSYSIERLGPGEWRVAARAPLFPREASGGATLDEGGRVTLDLELGAGQYRLAGRATRAGAPLTGLRVVLASAGGFAGGATTGAGGAFVIDSLPAGSYQLMLLGPGQTFTRELELSSDLEIELDPGPPVSASAIR